ncbi:hypothetical protein INR49_008584 [Caranx melampygus]|nr:hypothetical protein INR49_008584 [Caranx melampygus]
MSQLQAEYFQSERTNQRAAPDTFRLPLLYKGRSSGCWTRRWLDKRLSSPLHRSRTPRLFSFLSHIFHHSDWISVCFCTANMADSKVESSGELSAKELKEKKQTEEAENGEEAAANGKTDEENGEQENEVDEDEDDVGEEEEDEDAEGDEDDDEEDDLDGPTGKRAAEDDDDDEDEVETKKQKTDQ